MHQALTKVVVVGVVVDGVEEKNERAKQIIQVLVLTSR